VAFDVLQLPFMMPDSYKDEFLMPALQRDFKEIEAHVANLELYMNSYGASALDLLMNDVAKERLGPQIVYFDSGCTNHESVRYKRDGTAAECFAPRYEYTRLPSPYFKDNFDYNTLNKYTVVGSGTYSWVIGAGILTCSSTALNMIEVTDATMTDCHMIAMCTQSESSGLVARMKGSDYGYQLTIGDDTSASPGINLFMLDAGNATLLAGPFNVTWARGVSKTVELIVQGTTLEVVFDGCKLCSVTDDTHLSGSFGICSNSATSAIYTDLKVYTVVSSVWMEQDKGPKNLLTANQGNVETDLTGISAWSANASHTLTRDTAVFWEGTASAKLVSTYAGTQDMCISTDVYTTGVTADQVWSFGVQCKLNLGTHVVNGRQLMLEIKWFDTSNVYLSSGRQYFNANLEWSRYAFSAVAPTNAVKALCFAFLADAELGDILYWDGAAFGKDPYTIFGTYLPNYTDYNVSIYQDILNLYNDAAIGMSQDTFSVEFTFTPLMIGYRNYSDWFFNYYCDISHCYYIRRTTDGQFTMGLRSGSTYYSVTSTMSTPITVNTPYNICMSVDANKLRGYVNGTLIGEVDIVKSTNYVPECWGLGFNYDDYDDGASGLYSNFRISKSARTLNEHYNAFIAGVPLAVDDYTLLKMDFANTLRTTTRTYSERVVGTFTIAKYVEGTVVPQATHVFTHTFGADKILNQAIAELPSTGGVINILEGTFVISDTVFVPSNVTINMNTNTIIKSSASGDSVASFKNKDIVNGNTNIYITGGIVDGNYAESLMYDGIYFYNVTDSYVVDTTVRNSYGSGLYIANSSNVLIQGCIFDHNYLSGIRYTKINSCKFLSNTIQQNRLGAVSSTPTAGEESNSNVWANNVLVGSGIIFTNVTGLSIFGDYNTIVSNTINRNGGNGIDVRGNSNLITGNTVVSSNQNDDADDNIWILGDYNSVQSNTVRKGTRVTLPTFTRATTAYTEVGTEKSSGVFRYDSCMYGIVQSLYGILIEEGTTNLLSANQASIETDTTGFSAISGATLTRVTAEHWHGDASLRVVTPGSVNTEGFYTVGISASANTAYTATIYLKGSGNARIIFRDVTNNVFQDLYLALTQTWTRYVVTLTTGASAVTDLRVGVFTGGIQAITFYADGLQIEQKAAATYWHLGGATRNPEVLYAPIGGTFVKSSWSIEMLVSSISVQAVAGRYARLFEIYIDANNAYRILISNTGKIYVTVQSGGTLYSVTDTNTMSISSVYTAAMYKIVATGDGTTLKLYINGELIGSTAYVEPVGALPTNMYIGSNASGGEQCNCVIYDFCLHKVPLLLNDIELAYTYKWRSSLNENTTYKLHVRNSITLKVAPWSAVYGVNVYDATCDGNYVTNNDLYTAGETANLLDSGTGTITAAGNRV